MPVCMCVDVSVCLSISHSHCVLLFFSDAHCVMLHVLCYISVHMCVCVCLHGCGGGVCMFVCKRDRQTDRYSQLCWWLFQILLFNFFDVMLMTVLLGWSCARPGTAVHGRAGSHQEAGVNSWLRVTGLWRTSKTGGMSALCFTNKLGTWPN